MCSGEVTLINRETNISMTKMDSELTVDRNVISFTTALTLNSMYNIRTLASNKVGEANSSSPLSKHQSHVIAATIKHTSIHVAECKVFNKHYGFSPRCKHANNYIIQLKPQFYREFVTPLYTLQKVSGVTTVCTSIALVHAEQLVGLLLLCVY